MKVKRAQVDKTAERPANILYCFDIWILAGESHEQKSRELLTMPLKA